MPGGPLDLTNVKVSDTFPRLIQIATGAFYDGLGDPITFPGGSGPTGATGATGPTGSNGVSLSTLYSSGPGGSPTIVPGSVTINSSLDIINSYEYFNSLDSGIYFQTKLPNLNPGDSFYIGLFEYGGGLTYYGKIYYSGGPFIEIYDQLTLIASGNYNPDDVFSVYLDGYNVYYTVGLNSYDVIQSVNNFFASTIITDGFSGIPVNFSNILYYPTGKKGDTGATGPTGSNGATGATGQGTEFYFRTSKPSPDPSNVGARWIDSDNGVEYVWVYDGSNYVWMQPTQLGGIKYKTTSLNTSLHNVDFSFTYYGVIYTGGICTINLPLGSISSDEGKIIIIADEVGGISSYSRGILVNGTGGQMINGNSSILMKLERMSLTLIFRNNSWKTI